VKKKSKMDREEEFKNIQRQKEAYLQHLWLELENTRDRNTRMNIMKTIERTYVELKNLCAIDLQCDDYEIANLRRALALAEEKEAIQKAAGNK
jgi:hypothetical protein